MTTVGAVTSAFLEPFAEPFTYYGIAIGLLGLRTIREIYGLIRERV